MRYFGLILVLCFALWITPLPTQAQAGVSVTCSDGTSFDNGVEVTVHAMPAGVRYTASALGLNDFNPILAVIDPATGKGQCNDNNFAAGTFAAYLPTLGWVVPNPHTAQIAFSQTSGKPSADVTLVVGGSGGQGGKFLLEFEGLELTPHHTQDAFSLNVTQSMIDSGSKLTVYMIRRQVSALDPYMYQADSSLNPLTDSQGKRIDCDDGGESGLCQPGSVNLANYSVTLETGIQAGRPYDALLTLPLTGMHLRSNAAQNALNFVMTSSPRKASAGTYIAMFDLGIAPSSTSGTQPIPSVTEQAPDNSGAAAGISVTCSDGTQFDNGVQIIVRQMPLGFSYTATAVGIKGFDPVLAVLDSKTGQASCSGSKPGAAFYAANLPMTGSVPASHLSSQITFSQSGGQAVADIALVVGSRSHQSGEFLLMLEGMTSTPEAGAGDGFSVRLTPAIIASGVPLTVYMLASAQSKLDPYLYQTNSQFIPLTDAQGNRIDCDDAGTTGLCQVNSVDLSGSAVTVAAGKLTGQPDDAVLSLPLTSVHLSSDPSQNDETFVAAASPQHPTRGQYLLVFHIGTSG